MSTRSLHDRLKPVVVSIIEYAEPDRAADIILSLILSETVRSADPPDPKRKKNTNGHAPPPRAILTHESALASLDSIEPDREYATKEAAKLMDMEIGTFRAWYSVNPHLIDVIRKIPEGGGPHRTFFLGSEIIRARNSRMKSVSDE